MQAHRDLIAAARNVASSAARRAPDLDWDGAAPLHDVADLHRAGLLAAPLPSALGGADLGTGQASALALLDVLRLIGSGSLPLGRLYEGHANALILINTYATEAQRERLAGSVRAGHLFGVWNTEPAQGGLTLCASGGGWVLGGCKTFASGAGFLTRPLVTARTEEGGLLMLVVPLAGGERVDLSAWRPHGMRASATGTVDFTGLRVTPDDIIGADDDYHRQPLFSGGAWRFAAVQLGGIEAVFDAMRAHLRATGRTEDPHQRARTGEAAVAVETARLWVERAALTAAAEPSEPDRTVAYVNLARLAVERAGLDVLELAQRSVGLAGYLRDHPLERLGRDLATYLRQPAPDRALTTAAAHVLGTEAAAGDLWR